MTKALDALMRPKSIAILGATEKQGSLGREATNNIIRYGFKGDIYPINPKSETIFGLKAYKSILDVPAEQVDLALVVIPKSAIPAMIDECAQKGVKGLCIISAGFKETGEEGAQQERDMVEQAKKYGMTIIGPNCMGVINTSSDIMMDASFAEDLPFAGKTAFMSQSGALGAAILNISRDMKVGLSQFVSMGNKADTKEADVLDYWKDDEHVNQILLYFESIENSDVFTKLASEITKKKPIVAVKSGRSAAGASAASSHTGALAGTDAAADALLKQCGVIRANSILELFEIAQVFNGCPLPKGKRVAILTNTGGPGIMATDALCAAGLEISELKEETKAEMRTFLPAAASVKNPIDMIASAGLDHYTKSLEVLLKDENVDMVMVIYLPFMGMDPMDFAKAINEIKKQHPEKPIVSVFIAKKDFFTQLIDTDIDMPIYMYPEAAGNAMSKLYAQAEWVNRPVGTEPVYDVDKAKAVEIIKTSLSEGRDQLTTLESIDVLQAYGIRSCKYAFAANVDECAAEANKIGYPVVMKITSTKISHKTEVGGVIVGIASEEQLREEYVLLLERLKSHGWAPSDLDGFIVQEMVKGAREMVCGIATDPQFGPMTMFGLGGIYVETIKDVAFRINPLKDVDVKEMIESVKAYEILKGARGEVPAQIEQIEETLLRLSQLVKDFPFIDELDINPLKISDKDGEAIAVDGRIKVRMEEAKAAFEACCSGSNSCCCK